MPEAADADADHDLGDDDNADDYYSDDYYSDNHLGLLKLACSLICLNYLLATP